MSSEFMSIAQQEALLELYELGKKLELSPDDRRVHQMIYHTSLFNKGYLSQVLFGNGFYSNYNEMMFESEFFSFLYNFGLIGFILYMGVFIYILGAGIKKIRVNSLYIYLLFICILSILLSIFTGYTFFHPTTVVYICIAYIMFRGEQVNEKDIIWNN